MATIRFGQLGLLKPEKAEEYTALHANPWPGVLKTITDCNLRNYSIFRHGLQVFAYFEYVGEDYDADMEKWPGTPSPSSGGPIRSPAFRPTPWTPGVNFTTI